MTATLDDLVVATPSFDELRGRLVRTTNNRGRPAEGILIGVEQDPNPDYHDDDIYRVLVLSDFGGFDLSHALRVPEWRQLLVNSGWTFESLANLLVTYPDYTFTRRGRVVTIEALDAPSRALAPLRPLDCVYCVSERENGDPGNGGLMSLPGELARRLRTLPVDRVWLVLEVRDDDRVISFAPATGTRHVFNLNDTRVHRLYQATSADWCDQRVTVIRRLADHMQFEYRNAAAEDGTRGINGLR